MGNANFKILSTIGVHWFRFYEPRARVVKRNLGQVLIEYLLLTAVAAVAFVSISKVMREKLFILWVCEMAPRIQAPGGCNPSDANCHEKLIQRTALHGKTDSQASSLCSSAKARN